MKELFSRLSNIGYFKTNIWKKYFIWKPYIWYLKQGWFVSWMINCTDNFVTKTTADFSRIHCCKATFGFEHIMFDFYTKLIFGLHIFEVRRMRNISFTEFTFDNISGWIQFDIHFSSYLSTSTMSVMKNETVINDSLTWKNQAFLRIKFNRWRS